MTHEDLEATSFDLGNALRYAARRNGKYIMIGEVGECLGVPAVRYIVGNPRSQN